MYSRMLHVTGSYFQCNFKYSNGYVMYDVNVISSQNVIFGQQFILHESYFWWALFDGGGGSPAVKHRWVDAHPAWTN